MPEDQRESEMDEGQESEDQGSEDGGQEEFDQDRAMSTIRNLRALEKSQKQELKAAQDRLAELEKWKKDSEHAEMTELEQTQARVQKLEQEAEDAKSTAMARETEINEKPIRAEVRVVATRLGFANPDDAFALADLTDVAVEDGGSVKGVEKALKVLEKAKPYLLNGKDSGVGTPSRGSRKRGKTGEAEPTKPIMGAR